MLTALIETSVFISFLKRLFEKYHSFCGYLYYLYRQSQTARLSRRLWEKIITCLKNSFPGRITELNEEKNIALLAQSICVQWAVNLYKKCLQKLTFYFKNSRTCNLIMRLRKNLYSLSMATMGMMVIVIIVTNIFFSILFKKEIYLSGWLLQGLFLVIGLGGLFCNVNWQDLVKTSFVLNYLEGKKR